jgi:DNA polymerase elongation subunit (family B)
VDARYLFGYTGYRSAKFGQIQVHERITDTSRELLLKIKEMAEDMGFGLLHGIVDCLWVVGEPILKFKEAVERETGILTKVDSYNWITFLPMSDHSGAYNRYTGIYIPLQKENKNKGEAYRLLVQLIAISSIANIHGSNFRLIEGGS